MTPGPHWRRNPWLPAFFLALGTLLASSASLVAVLVSVDDGHETLAAAPSASAAEDTTTPGPAVPSRTLRYSGPLPAGLKDGYEPARRPEEADITFESPASAAEGIVLRYFVPVVPLHSGLDNVSAEQLAALLHQKPQPLRHFSMRIPDYVQRVVDLSLARDRDFRYASGAAMAADLRTALQRLRAFGDVEIEDAGLSGASGPLDSAQKVTPPAPKREAAQPQSRSFGVDTITGFGPGSPFDMVIISPNVYPWTTRGASIAGGAAQGTAISIEGEMFEVVAADQQRADLNRYFLVRWPENTIIRRVFDYTPDLTARLQAAARARESESNSGPLGSVISNLFGKRRRDG